MLCYRFYLAVAIPNFEASLAVYLRYIKICAFDINFAEFAISHCEGSLVVQLLILRFYCIHGADVCSS